MTTYVALLRAVNVGGRARVPMAALRGVADSLGLLDPQTLLQSGNLVFRAPAVKASSLERTLEAGVSGRLGLAVDIIVRTSGEWRRVIERNPFPDEARADPAHLLVMALKRAPKASEVEALQASTTGRELARPEGAHLYLVYPDGIGRSRLTAAVIEKAIGTRGTARNWNTVVKLANLCDSPATTATR
jgi:uncharacterized protein (DUF1697 family)